MKQAFARMAFVGCKEFRRIASAATFGGLVRMGSGLQGRMRG